MYNNVPTTQVLGTRYIVPLGIQFLQVYSSSRYIVPLTLYSYLMMASQETAETCSWYVIVQISSSSSCSLRVRCVPCSLVLKVELVPPSLLRSSNVPSSFWSVFQCLSWQSISVHPLYVLQPLFLVLFYFLYYVLWSRFFPNIFFPNTYKYSCVF